MNKQQLFRRKLLYGLGILLLLYPLSILSRPATSKDPQGGVLSTIRVENDLSQANLGDIDPASATMKLATLGLRGVAVTLLCGQAEEYKKKEDWTGLTATLEQLAMLQPNFITFWKYQSWNVSYNVSVLCDDYRDRYYYVRRGIQFLQEGISKNRENREVPQLLWDLGWFTGQKIGRADEQEQYRRLFKADDEFHGDDPPRGSDERDNWRVSKRAYQVAVDAVDIRNKSLGRKSGNIFYASPAKSQMAYGRAIESEGSFEKGQDAWEESLDDWNTFGEHPIVHSTGTTIHLGNEEKLTSEVKAKEKEFEELSPGLRQKIAEERRKALLPDQLAAYEKPAKDRNDTEWELTSEVNELLDVSDFDLMERIAKDDPDLRKKAGIIGTDLMDLRVKLIYTQRYKEIVNYNYWKLRAEFEQTDIAVEARRKMFQAKSKFADGQSPIEAKQLYEEGFDKWKELLGKFPKLSDPSGATGDDLLVFILEYRDVLASLDLTIPDDFVLWDIIESFDAEQEFAEELEEYKVRMDAKKSSTTTTDETPAP